MFKKILCNSVAQITFHLEAARVDPIQKRRLSAEVAEALGQRIGSGALKEKLPGVRLLARSLGVSVPTVCEALRLLEIQGLLDSGGTRRRWRVKQEPPTKPSPGRQSGAAAKTKNRSGRLLFISSQPLNNERHSGVEVLAELLDLISVKGWELMHRVVDFTTARQPRKSWDEVLEIARPDAIVALGGTPVLAKWTVERQIRTLFLGGDPGDSGVPMLAVKVSTMLRHALDHLLGLGHRRILMPLCGRSPKFVAVCRKTAAEAMSGGAGRPEKIVIAETAYAGPEVTVNLLRGQWKTDPPDALILLDWREFVAASCYFKERGIEIPRDLSVVILSQNTVMDWHSPRISHFEHPAKQMARMVSKWLADGTTKLGEGATMEVHARWVPEQSTRKRP